MFACVCARACVRARASTLIRSFDKKMNTNYYSINEIHQICINNNINTFLDKNTGNSLLVKYNE